ncbi:MAG: 2-C-methyl-D-erythritol 4-phosphate cytidylyltransferase [Clostridia bacterium]|nr:2-C-methyl-D-erythritol 4-phosphate cytidylyltransferase [Clostridia bacterium]
MSRNIKTSAIIAAAGSGTRMKSDVAKQFIEIGGMPVLARTLSVFENASEIDEIIIATRECDIDGVWAIAKEYKTEKVTVVICGGATRQETISKALEAVSGEKVLIHDGARPFIKAEQINAVAEALSESEAAALGIPVTDTIKTVKDGYITGTIDRTNLVSIQTPQGFKTNIIKKAHKRAAEMGVAVTDDCALCEEMGIKIKVIQGSQTNIKLTTQGDLAIADGIIAKERGAE